MADASGGGGRPLDNRKRSLTYLSTIFRKTTSIAEAPIGIDEAFPGRTRRFSESSLGEFDESEHGREVADALHQNDSSNSLPASADGSSKISYDEKSLTQAAMKVGTLNENGSDLAALPRRKTSQTEYLNKPLLESLFSKINSVASTFIDTSSSGPPRSDDVLMDKILRRMENVPTKKD